MNLYLETPTTIYAKDGEVWHRQEKGPDFKPAVKLRKDRITIGCFSISAEAALHIMCRWHAEFDNDKPREVIL